MSLGWSASSVTLTAHLLREFTNLTPDLTELPTTSFVRMRKPITPTSTVLNSLNTVSLLWGKHSRIKGIFFKTRHAFHCYVVFSYLFAYCLKPYSKLFLLVRQRPALWWGEIGPCPEKSFWQTLRRTPWEQASISWIWTHSDPIGEKLRGDSGALEH